MKSIIVCSVLRGELGCGTAVCLRISILALNLLVFCILWKERNSSSISNRNISSIGRSCGKTNE